MSGAGKSSALKMLEDVGYFCVDNLPTRLLCRFAELTLDKTANISNVALGIDIRSGASIDEFLEELKKVNFVSQCQQPDFDQALQGDQKESSSGQEWPDRGWY